MLAGLADLRASEDLQDKALISLVEAFTAAARRQPQAALRHARAVLAHADALGISHDTCAGRGRWPPAPPTTWATPPPPASCSPCSTPTSPGTWPRCCGPNATWPAPAWPPRDGDPAAAAAFAAAISSLREQSTPYHLAHGLLDHAGYLTPARCRSRRGRHRRSPRHRRRLRCQPLLDRADAIEPAKPRTAAS